MTEQLTLDLAVDTGVTECALAACRVCTGCVHGDRSACRGTIRCPDDGIVRPCRYAKVSEAVS